MSRHLVLATLEPGLLGAPPALPTHDPASFSFAQSYPGRVMGKQKRGNCGSKKQRGRAKPPPRRFHKGDAVLCSHGEFWTAGSVLSHFERISPDDAYLLDVQTRWSCFDTCGVKSRIPEDTDYFVQRRPCELRFNPGDPVRILRPTNCGAVGCNSTSQNMELSACSRCMSISYCSKKCQARDWKSGKHKLKCAELAQTHSEDKLAEGVWVEAWVANHWKQNHPDFPIINAYQCRLRNSDHELVSVLKDDDAHIQAWSTSLERLNRKHKVFCVGDHVLVCSDSFPVFALDEDSKSGAAARAAAHTMSLEEAKSRYSDDWEMYHGKWYHERASCAAWFEEAKVIRRSEGAEAGGYELCTTGSPGVVPAGTPVKIAASMLSYVLPAPTRSARFARGDHVMYELSGGHAGVIRTVWPCKFEPADTADGTSESNVPTCACPCRSLPMRGWYHGPRRQR